MYNLSLHLRPLLQSFFYQFRRILIKWTYYNVFLIGRIILFFYLILGIVRFETNSILIKEFDFKSDNTKYEIKEKNDPSNEKNVVISPFYEDSPELIEERLKQMVLSAKKRLYIVAQHISSYRYQIPKQFKLGGDQTGNLTKYGFLNELLTRTAHTCDIKCISQTFVNSKGNNMGARKPANTTSFTEFMQKIRSTSFSRILI